MKLHDNPADVVRKALRGLDLAPSLAALKAGIPSEQVMEFLAGQFNPKTASALAEVLELSTEGLLKLPDYHPPALSEKGITRLSLPFEDDIVNAWLLEMDGTRLLIDLGFGSTDLAEHLSQRQLGHCHALVTHAHRDHVGGLPGLHDQLQSLRAPEPISGALPCRPGESFSIGCFEIEVLELSGHHPRSVGYLIHGFANPVFAVGDAVFAGSIGGCSGPDAYALARANIQNSVLSQAPETQLLPGHGPPTTIGSERRSNPFLSVW